MNLTLVSAFIVESRVFLVALLHASLAILVTVDALMRKREVPSAIGWIGLAWLAPLLGPIFYAAFGINRVKRKARRLRGPVQDAGTPAFVGGVDDPLENLKRGVGAVTRRELATGKVVKILHCGDEGYPEMLAAIDRARVSIRLATYIFRDDEAGSRFIDALARARKRGVRIAVLIDGVGGGFFRSPAFDRLTSLGVPAARFLHSLLPWKMPVLDLRLHKKCLLIDGETAFVGGLNIGAENILASRPKEPVRDMHFHIEGSVIGQIEQQFDDDWAFATGRSLHDMGPVATFAPSGEPARAIVAGPDLEDEPMILVLLLAVNSARRSIRICTPYFLPDEQLVTALRLASARGVEVDLVLPAINNHPVVAWAASAHIRPLLQGGCRIWRSPPPFDHSKLIAIDDAWAMIGSANWDMRSLRLNFEMNVEFHDASFARDLSRVIESRRGERITLAELDNRPFIVKLRDAAARLAMPYI